ncbi:MAG TPA: 16S rRNA (cytosine(1402)-N(4))-methyltransferase RsmH [Candidatus Magasanikbacteria bacterium]|nr:16S rRNA (cytosine(1402)-N(4))-methyltransferase RsmH [Candidatus Magasanikbacteria bacterium]
MRHIPVLLNEVLEGLSLKKGAKVIDCTLGDGGHSEAIMDIIGPRGKLLGLDADPESLLRAKRFLYRFEDQIVFIRENFANLKKTATENDFLQVDGILFDLGWSSPQFAERSRGFSFDKDEPLNMRYDNKCQVFGNENCVDAAHIINEYNLEDLVWIFKNYGEEDLSIEIAQAILKERKNKKITTSKDLTEIVLEVYRQKLRTDKEIPWVGGLHPATKVFQALRIAVNNELEILSNVLPDAFELLKSGGRLAVISFHSLEDRIIKHFFQSLPYAKAKIITKKPITATEQEINQNPRARSAKLRIIEKI